MEKPILKAYYGNIFFEFLTYDEPKDSVIFLPGFPSSNKYDVEMRFLFKKGYNVFFPRYKGTYQSKGLFLKSNIVRDIQKFLNEIKKGKAESLWDLNIKKFSTRKIILFGGSFSGAIACGLSSIDKNISKIILSAPVWDFKKHNSDGNEQDLQKLVPFIKRAYSNLYRFRFNNLINTLFQFKELSPSFYLEKLQNKQIPILVLHDPRDKTVSIKHSLYMKNKLPKLKIIKHFLGHPFGIKLIENKWKEINKFIKS